ncbi:MAG: KEOPS complex subunit Pcc1 [Methanomassiliicoccales archaeon]
MSIECTIEISYSNKTHAETIRRAIELENENYATASVEENILVIKATAASIPSLLHTVEDLLVCIKAAEDAMEIGGAISSHNAFPNENG